MKAEDKEMDILILILVPFLSVLVCIITIVLYTFRVITETIKYEFALLLSLIDGVFVNFESKCFKDTIENFRQIHRRRY